MLIPPASRRDHILKKEKLQIHQYLACIFEAKHHVNDVTNAFACRKNPTACGNPGVGICNPRPMPFPIELRFRGGKKTGALSSSGFLFQPAALRHL
jgi:hypothetical protein